MATRPKVFTPHSGAGPAKAPNREADQRRGSRQERGYGRPWEKAAASHLRRSPLCRYCEVGAFGQAPRSTAAALVDHLYPHRTDSRLFWITDLWVSACHPCHNGPKQAIERKGLAGVPDLDRLARLLGLPTKAEAYDA